MLNIETDSMRIAYREVVRVVKKDGHATSPRGHDTIEVSGALITLTNPYDALPTGTGRRLNVSLCVAEFLHLVAGEDDPAFLIKVAPHYASFVDPATGRLRGSYGRRVRGQMEDAVEKLRLDPQTRQATVTFWDPFLDQKAGEHDYPCIVAAGWQLVHGQLDAFAEMRSNDVWLGLPGDMFMMTQLQLTIAHILGVTPGWYRHYDRSLHLYARDFDRAGDLVEDDTLDWEPTFTGLKADSWPDAAARARALLAGITPTDATPGEAAMRDRVAKFL